MPKNFLAVKNEKEQSILSLRFQTKRLCMIKKNHAVVLCILVIFILLSSLR